jgi:hypothetical protein
MDMKPRSITAMPFRRGSSRKRINVSYPSIDLVGSYNTIKSFSEYVENTLSYNGTIHEVGKIFRIQFRGMKAKEIIEHLYKDSNIYLDRKKILADKYTEDMTKSSL